MASFDYDEDEEYVGEESPEAEEDDEEESAIDNAQVVKECLSIFAMTDCIMEPGVFNTLQKYFQSRGAPEQVVELLSDNYKAVAQTVNLLAEWLILSGVNIKEVQEIVETHLKEMILKNFDPQKADSIFSDEGETPSWLGEMIDHPTWRQLFYKLAEEYPDCLVLNFTIKLISDAGYQGEITSVATACHQIEVFSRVLRTYITSFLEGGEEAMKKNLPEFTKMVCHGEHTYLYSQLLMHILAQEPKGGTRIRRLCQEVQRCAKERGIDVTPITLALNGAAAYPKTCQALSAMLSRNALNPADITVLYKDYSSSRPPPVELIRTPEFLDLCIDTLFKPGSRVNPEHKSKYIFLLAYASSVFEVTRKKEKILNKEELKPTSLLLEKAHSICMEKQASSELIVQLNPIFQCLKFPIVAMAVLKWVEYTVSEPSYFKLNTDHTPLHLVMLDEIVSNHFLLHEKVLNLLITLFESPFEDLDVLVQLELRKTLLDRMVHLLSKGCVLTVLNYIKTCWQSGDTDISLIRHFVTEVLDVVTEPYTSEFVQLFLPLIENDDIIGSLRSEEENSAVTQFIAHCKTNF